MPKEAVVAVWKALPQIVLECLTESTETQVAIVYLRRDDIEYGIHKFEDGTSFVATSCYSVSDLMSAL